MSKLTQKTKAQLASMSEVALRILPDYELGQRDINKCATINVYNLAQALSCKTKNIWMGGIEPSFFVS